MKVSQLINTTLYMDKLGQDMAEELSEVMRNNGSLNMYKEINFETTVNANGFVVRLIAPKGVYFHSFGRAAGKFPPFLPLLNWVEQRKIQFRNRVSGKYLSYKTTAYIVRAGIGKMGTKGFRTGTAPHFLEGLKLKDQMLKEIIANYKSDILDNIEVFCKKNLKAGSVGVYRNTK